MAKWRLECQTCQKAKLIDYPMVAACDDKECNYKPFKNNVSTGISTDNRETYMENGVPQNGKNW